MDTNTGSVPRPTSASPIPISGPLSNNPNYYYKPSGATQVPRATNPTNFYHNTANNVTKFTNMTVSSAGSKNPLKPSLHYPQSNIPISSGGTNVNATGTSSNSNIANMSNHPNANLSAPNTSGMAPKTTLKASDLIHILPNLFNTLKRRNSNSGINGPTGNGSIIGGKGHSSYFNSNGTATNSLAAAVAAAASNSGKPLTTSSAAAFVAEQLLNVASSGPFSDDSSSSPPPQQHMPSSKRLRSSDPNALQCDICGKLYKHRNCLSKHMWEHHESWEHTRKVCQTKHQQVQLLEAAQVLTEIISGVVRNRSSNGSSNNPNNSGSDYDETDEYENEPEDEISTTDKLQEMEITESHDNSNSNSEEDDNISIG